MAKLSESAVQTITEICHRYDNERNKYFRG